MDSKIVKSILLEAIKSAEKTLERDIKKDEQSKKIIHYLLQFFKNLGLDTINRLLLEGKLYVKDQIKSGLRTVVLSLSNIIYSIVKLITGFLIISIGLVFGAIAFSLWLGEIVGSSALGFVIGGISWVLIMFIVIRFFINKNRIEKMIKSKININF
ncbi:hypothetical protein [Winogradskyella immobilis]|uniref:Superfamily III holin-X n=1 Tax=Winogradskyella immobilis TaxID=2816852 RepID=A0ABS8EMN4_9FLAO|nr:hypothetical protein [Winogradskyella immobilis]MCC1484480.1 hypothetical protein [Winogradskyella immobilis]MCG0016572.1 hypothetical protein [Winogradskyella immobilis]